MRRVGLALGNAVTQKAPADGTGFDRFGRLTDLHFKDASDVTLQ